MNAQAPPPRVAPPPPRVAPPGNGGQAPTPRQLNPGKFSISGGVEESAKRILEYGTGGIGKTTLASLLSQVGVEPVVIDIDSGSSHLDVQRLHGISNWNDLRDAINSDILDGFGAIVLDTVTRAQRMAIEWVLENKPLDGRKEKAQDLEQYGFGKGYTHLVDTFTLLLQDLDRHVREGRHVILIAHDVVEKVPNPEGQDWIRWEPDLINYRNANLRAYIKNWCSHVLYVGYDISVGSKGESKGKAIGGGTRTIYASETSTIMAKSRPAIEGGVPYNEGDAEIWRRIFQKGA